MNVEKTIAILAFILFPWLLWAVWTIGEWMWRKIQKRKLTEVEKRHPRARR